MTRRLSYPPQFKEMIVEKLVRSMEVIDELVMSVDDQEKVRGGQRSVKEKQVRYAENFDKS